MGGHDLIIKKFEEQVRKHPNHIAVKTLKDELSYQELHKYSNNLAHEIIARSSNVHVTNEQKTIALLFEHSTDMIVSVVGAVKANTTYVPLDASYPTTRLSYMIENSKSDFIITNDENMKLAKEFVQEKDVKSKIINISEIKKIKLDNFKENKSQNRVNDVGYILYTSGSTGTPKGVIQSYKNILHFVECYTDILSITHEDKMTLFSAFSHDGSIPDIYGALLNGATLYPINIGAQTDINDIIGWLQKEKITIWHSVPTLYRFFMSTITENDKFPDLRFFVLGGETILLRDISVFQKNFNDTDTKFATIYGQSESTINSMQIYSSNSNVKHVTLGQPLKDTEVIVADDNGEEVSPLKDGEIVILSDHVALGYWDDKIKSKEVFKHYPEIGRAYHTGDLGKLLLDGTVEFLGRKDSQVKIRGYRIELGEIENWLLELECIKETAVLAIENETGEKYLCAYIVADNEVSAKQMRQSLSESLPEYMIPTHFVRLDKMPLMPNGKTDHKSLLNLKSISKTSDGYKEPRNTLEDHIAKIWQDTLGIEKVGIYDDFFELGGHSLKGMIVASKIHKELNINLPLRELFKNPTISELSEYLSNAEQNTYCPITKSKNMEYYEISSAQKRMFVLQQLNTDAVNYNMPSIMILDGVIEEKKIDSAITKLIDRHEVLRTSFETVENQIVQKVHESINFSIGYVDKTNEFTEDVDDHINQVIKEFIKPFDLSKAPLCRAHLIKLESEKHIFLLDIHHIISDGTSISILTKEFLDLYEAKELPPQRIQYKDFSEWHNAWMKSDNFMQQEKYWLDKFSDDIPILNMPIDYVRPTVQEFAGDNISIPINKDLSSKLKTIAKETGSTLYMVLISAIHILLSKYTGQEDIIIGSPIAGRSHSDLGNMLGMFVNTLAMRSYPKSCKSYIEFLEDVKEDTLRAYENQDYPFAELIEKLNLSRDISRNPLFDIMFTLQNIEIINPEFGEAKLTKYELSERNAKFDLTFTAVELEDYILIDIEYRKSLFKKETIERMSEHLLNIIELISKNKNVLIGDINIISEKERSRILTEFNDTYIEYPKDKTLHQLFEERASKEPDKVALVFRDKSMTYGELNMRSNQLARILRLRGVKDNSIVGIMLDRSFEMVIGILGILKAGGSYMPIDIACPENRISFMLEDSEAYIVLAQSWFDNKLPSTIEKIHLDKMTYEGETSDLDNINNQNSLAYVIYTSGSTGVPKGVMVEHGSVINLLYDMEKHYSLSKNDAYLLKTAYTFDVSVPELFGWILPGEKLIILDQGQEGLSEKIIDIVHNKKVTHIYFVPSTLNMFLASLDTHSSKSLESLKYVFIIGEALKQETVTSFYKHFNQAKLENVYGPAEATVYVSRYTSIIDEQHLSVPIGIPSSNVSLYVISKDGSLQPIGIEGELCISGICLSRGYLKRPELTEEKFIDNPFVSGERMYRTGDLAKWLQDGNLEFLGRIDHQVKIRGFRIEIGEIENQLLNIKPIKEALVIDREDESLDKYLCAYIVSDNYLSAGDLRKSLSENLPDYMIPSYFVQLDSFPLNSSGKVDRKMLPPPDVGTAIKVEYKAPENTMEESVLKIWSEVLGIEKIGVNDNFFEIGGHSLKATIIASRIHKELQVELPLKELFKSPTISEISEYLSKADRNKYSSIEKSSKKDHYEASPAQKRMFLLQQLNPDTVSYNIPSVLTVDGEIEKDKLESAVKMLIDRYEVLRTSFYLLDDKVMQHIHNDVAFSLEYAERMDEYSKNADECMKESVKIFRRSFDLGKAPLLRAGLIKLEKKKYLLLLDVHHIVSDGTSMSILTREFMKLYKFLKERN